MTKRKPKFQMTVKLELDDSTEVPEDVNCKDVDTYVRTALESWGGQFKPDHPLHSSNIRKVTCQTKYAKY